MNSRLLCFIVPFIFFNYAVAQLAERTPAQIYFSLFEQEVVTYGQSLKIDCRGKLITKTFENFLKKYIIKYVLCTQCNNLKTEFNRKDKSYEIKCLNCSAFRYVS